VLGGEGVGLHAGPLAGLAGEDQLRREPGARRELDHPVRGLEAGAVEGAARHDGAPGLGEARGEPPGEGPGPGALER
jgi:hypothetical protein